MMNPIVLAAVLLNCAATAYACGGQILSQNFDKYSGDYKTWSKPMAKEDFDGLIFLKFDDFSEVGDGNLRVTNPKGCVGTSGCGATFDVKLPPMDEATLSYRFKHSPGYVYGLGGKLPGMCAMDCPSGCQDVTASSGFNARVMWRENGDLMSYTYYGGQDPAENCGENWLWGVSATSGGWNTIEMYVKVNTDGQANGVQTIKYNGAEVYSKTDVLWSQTYQPIEKFTFRSFHGGSGDEWASAQDQYIYFDDIKISGGKCSSGGAADTTTEPIATAPEVVDPVDTGAKAADDSGDADNCGTFMAPVCTTGKPCKEGFTPSTGDQFGGESICRPAGGDGQSSDDMGGGVTTESTGEEETGGEGPGKPLKQLEKPAKMVEEEDGEPETVKQSDVSVDIGGSTASASASAGLDLSCNPPPGFYCTASGREREIKDRTRKPKDRKKL